MPHPSLSSCVSPPPEPPPKKRRWWHSRKKRAAVAGVVLAGLTVVCAEVDGMPKALCAVVQAALNVWPGW